MRAPRLLVSHSLTSGGPGTLDADQARQLRSVLRLTSGREIVVFDGTGAEASATITALDRLGGTFLAGELRHPDREPPIDLTVGLALLRGEKFEIAVQKLTEIGVQRIVPLRADRCMVSYPDAREWGKRALRLERIVRGTAEQSERVTLPVLDVPMKPVELLKRENRVIALTERSDITPLHDIDLPIESRVTLMVGPEGGWSDAEVALLASGSVMAASLGALILRAETAAIVAAGTLVQAAWAKRAPTAIE